MKKKTILIAGYTGTIGSAMADHLKQHRIIGIGRKDFQKNDSEFVREYEKADMILNFAGTPVIRRWTSRNRRKIMESRILTTKKLGLILNNGTPKERHLINASAVGIYSGQGIHTEKSMIKAEGFMRQVVDEWEKEALQLAGKNSKVAVLRIGVVLSKQGGMPGRLLPLFKWGLGGRIGSGKQAFAWIHIMDLLRATENILEQGKTGIYNLVAPGICTNREFTRILSRILHRPAILAVPVIALRLIYGKGAEVLSGGQYVLPERLKKEGFVFRYPDLETALLDIVN